MNDFFKYLTTGDEDRNWGLYLNVAGKSQVAAEVDYPSADHPTGYHFSWEQGRMLDEFQINYITEGFGELENEFGKAMIKPGTLVITRPGVWHRYRPNRKTGWTENYIGFDGTIARQLLAQPVLSMEQSLLYCGAHEAFIDTYYKIFDLVLAEKPGYQQIASGLVVKLLGYIVAWQKNRNFEGKEIEAVIQKIRFTLRENVGELIDIRTLAEENNIGYSYFRKMFKKYTGVSPHQYYLDLKVMRAKELLLTTNKSIKEISYELGFESIHYFSRFFKKKVGYSPGKLRK